MKGPSRVPQVVEIAFWKKYLSVLIVLASLAVPQEALATGTGLPTGGVSVVTSTLDRVVLDVHVPAYRMEESDAAGRGYSVLAIENYGHSDQVGYPQVPQRGVMIGIPPGADVSLQVTDVSQTIQDVGRLLPSPGQILDVASPLEDIVTGEAPVLAEYVEDPKVYGEDAFWPSAAAEVVEIGNLRDWRYAEVMIRPVQYNALRGQVRSIASMRLILQFSYPRGRPETKASGGDLDSGYEAILKNVLLNYDSARSWREDRTDSQVAAADLPAYLSGPAYKLTIAETGIYSLSYAYLQNAGLPLSQIDPRRFRIFNMGAEVAIRVVGEEDGRFDPGDYVLFYGESLTTKFVDRNVYWLTYNQTVGKRMASKDGTPSDTYPTPAYFLDRLPLEQDTYYTPLIPGEDDFDRWYWTYITAPSPYPERSIPFSLSVIATPAVFGGNAVLHASLLGFNYAPHQAQVYVNDHLIADHQWSDRQWWREDLAFPQDYLVEGQNVIKVVDPLATSDGILIDSFYLDYADAPQAADDVFAFAQKAPGTWEFHVGSFTNGSLEVYDVTDPGNVVQVQGSDVVPGTSYELQFEDSVGDAPRAYWAQSTEERLEPEEIKWDSPSSLHDTRNSAQYLVISHHDFMASATALAMYRASLGMASMVVDVQDVYDEFGFGMLNPHAIRDFLSYAYSNWRMRPVYVVLVGDGNYDYKNNYGEGLVNYIPPYLANVDPYISETAADNRYASVVGDDPLPDFYLGRLPVDTAAEAQAVVDKIVSYEQPAAGIGWRAKLEIVADNVPDDAGHFVNLSDTLVDGYTDPAYTIDKLYLNDYCGPPTTTPCPAARNALVVAINEGRLLVNYIGHAAQNFWAHEKVLHVDDIPSLTNADALPILLPMTCWDGYFHDVWIQSLGESIVRAGGKGAIASWSPSGKGVVTGHQWLDRGFFQAVFQDGVQELGAATLAGRLNLWGSGDSLDLIDTYHLFGDPALRINALYPDLRLHKTVQPTGQVDPGDTLTYTLTFSNAGDLPARDVTLTDILPPELVNPTVLYASPEVLTQAVGITYAWDIADLDPGAGGTIQIRAAVAPTLSQGVVVNEAEITSPLSGDIASVTTGVNVPDLFVTKTGPAEATFGQTIPYTITWGHRESGQVTATGVRLTDTLPQWVEYVGDDSGLVAAPDPDNHQVVWMVPGDVPVGTQESFVLTVEVTSSPHAVGPLLNQVEIASSLRDGNPEDDHSQWTTALVDEEFYVYLPLVFKTASGTVVTPERSR